MFDAMLEIKEMHENSRTQIEKFDTQFSKFEISVITTNSGTAAEIFLYRKGAPISQRSVKYQTALS
jgi:hypothetical protein